MSTDGKTKVISFTNGENFGGCSRSSELHLTCGDGFKLTSAKGRNSLLFRFKQPRDLVRFNLEINISLKRDLNLNMWELWGKKNSKIKINWFRSEKEWFILIMSITTGWKTPISVLLISVQFLSTRWIKISKNFIDICEKSRKKIEKI